MKIVIVPYNFEQAMRYVDSRGLKRNEYIILTDVDKIKGLDYKSLVFVFLEGFLVGDYFSDDIMNSIEVCLGLGAVNRYIPNESIT